MIPEEQKLVDVLFDRLAQLENAPRDPDAERLIAADLQRAPHAVYALVQTALVQDEALKRANARIEELEAQLGGDEAPQPRQQQASFLDTMRDAMFGRPERPAGSMPSVRPQAAPFSPPPGREPPMGYGPQGPAPGYPPQPPYPPGPAFGGGTFGGGRSFLGAAASTAAGVVGGSLLLDGIRSMFGHHAGLGAVDPLGGSSSHAAPLIGSNSGHDDLAGDLGIDHIGHAPDADKPAPEHVADVPDDTDDQYVDDGDYAADGGFDDDTYDA
jgi:hypothetical protein